MTQQYIDDAETTVLLSIDGVVHLVAMHKGKYDMISYLVKASAEKAIKTEVSSNDLRRFLGVDK